MESVLESQRRTHEESERLEDAIVKLFMNRPKTYKEKIARDHKINNFVERIKKCSKQLLDMYSENNSLRKEEIQRISAPNEFSEFYKRLKSIKDYHRKFPNETVDPMELEFLNVVDVSLEEQRIDNIFSGEEGFGRFLDLHTLFEEYRNLSLFSPHTDYLGYLDQFDNFTTVLREQKKLPRYQLYLTHLSEYLKGFLGRIQPLRDLNDIEDEIRLTFNEDFQCGRLPGWGIESSLYCEACEKQFAKQTVFEAHLTGKKHLNAVKGERIVPDLKGIAYLEVLIQKYGEILGKERDDTKANVERRQAMTASERAQETSTLLDAFNVDMVNRGDDLLEHQKADKKDDEEIEKPIYNPLNIPLGWDGKPIPYWLYKLHGLNIEYVCEICGNYTYRGRRPYEKHFQEWRHAHGLKCLGITNSKHFQEITKIDEAVALWNKLKHQGNNGQFQADVEEEYEDSEGNVFNKKTYDDLRRQGLL